MKNVVLNRQEIYDMVWSTPATSILKKYVLTYTEFKKLCTRMEIPLPKAGHWEKLKAGKEVEITELSTNYNGSSEISLDLRKEGEESLKGKQSPEEVLRDEIESDSSLNIVVPDTLIKPHKLITETKNAHINNENRHSKNFTGYLRSPLSISATKLNYGRALRIMDTFIKAMEQRGHVFKIKNDSVHLIIYGEEFTISIREKNSRIPKPKTSSWQEYDYVPFGMEMPGRKWQGTSDKYRYSHNSHEREDAIFEGAQSAEYWMYDSRIGRRWERDPIVKPWESPYATFGNNPIYFADPLGLDGDPPVAKKGDATGAKGTVAPNGGVRNGEGGVVGGEPVCLGCGKNGENTYGIPADEPETAPSPSPPAASTGNGPNSGQPLPNPPKQSDPSPQHLYNNTWLVTWGSNTLYSASNNNTMNWYHVSYLGETNWWNRADWSKGDGGATLGYGAGSISTNGDWTAGYGKFSVGGDLSGNPNSLAYNGGYGGSVSADGLRVGPLGATMENWVQDGVTAIVHDYYGGPATKTINATFIGTKISTSLSYSMGLRGVLSETLSNGFQRSSNLGSKSVIGANIGLKSGEFGAEISIPLKYK